jgi:hypothetical protein
MSATGVERDDWAETHDKTFSGQFISCLATSLDHVLQKAKQHLIEASSDYDLAQLSDCMLEDIGVSHTGVDYLEDRGRETHYSLRIEWTD